MKMRDFEAAAAVIAFGWLLCGCSVKPAGGDDNGDGNGAGERIQIRVATAVTRVADERFEDVDVLGLFVVNEPEALAASGNQYDNEPLTFAGSALISRELYYRDDRTNASLRKRLGVKDSLTESISRLIKEAVSQRLIKPLDPDTAPRYMKNIPTWA